MAICKYCEQPMDWATVGGRWTTLVPVGQDTHLEKQYQDESGNFRAAHKLVCPSSGSGVIAVIKLQRPVAPEITPDNVDPETGEIVKPKTRKKKGA